MSLSHKHNSNSLFIIIAFAPGGVSCILSYPSVPIHHPASVFFNHQKKKKTVISFFFFLISSAHIKHVKKKKKKKNTMSIEESSSSVWQLALLLPRIYRSPKCWSIFKKGPSNNYRVDHHLHIIRVLSGGDRFFLFKFGRKRIIIKEGYVCVCVC